MAALWLIWCQGDVARRTFTGLVVFIAGQVTALLVAALAVTWAHTWTEVGHFFTTLSAVGLTGLLAAPAAVLVCGGLATVRRVAVWLESPTPGGAGICHRGLPGIVTDASVDRWR